MFAKLVNTIIAIVVADDTTICAARREGRGGMVRAEQANHPPTQPGDPR